MASGSRSDSGQPFAPDVSPSSKGRVLLGPHEMDCPVLVARELTVREGEEAVPVPAREASGREAAAGTASPEPS